MTRPEAERQEDQLSPLPTTLDLFHYRGREREQLRGTLANATLFFSASASSSKALESLIDTSTQRADRLEGFKKQILQQAADSFSSVNCSEFYLRLQDELLPQGVSYQDIFETAVRLLESYIAFDEEGSKIYPDAKKTLNAAGATKDRRVTHRLAQPLLELMKQFYGEPPSWWNKTRDEWADFSRGHLIAMGISSTQQPRSVTTQSLIAKMTISPSGYPDWLLDNNGGKAPSRETVEEELTYDKAYIEEQKRLFAATTQQQGKVKDLLLQKSFNMANRMEPRRKALRSEGASFPGFLLYLGATSQTEQYAVDLSQFGQSDMEMIYDKYVLSADNAREKEIKDVEQDETISLSPEVIALWLEKNLKEAAIAHDMQTSITPELLQSLQPLLQPDASQDARPHRALRYEVLPFVRILPSDQLASLEELARYSVGEPLEPIIWELAGLISSNLRDSEKVDERKQANAAINHVKEFGIKWIRNNWMNASIFLYQALQQPDMHAQEKQQETAEPTGVLFSGMHEDILEIEQIVDEEKKGSLNGWHIQYAEKPTIDPKYHVMLGGETIDEREEVITDYIGRNKIPCNIKPQSVIGALEEIASAPAKVEYMRHKIWIDGEQWKKLPRGDVRIIYRTDTDAKTVVFFLYQKKAMEYRL